MGNHDFYEQPVYGWMCHNHPFKTMEDCLMADIKETTEKVVEEFVIQPLEGIQSANLKYHIYDEYDKEHFLHVKMKHSAYNYDYDCSICKDEGPPSIYAPPPVAQPVEATDSKPAQSEFESQQEDFDDPPIAKCPNCGAEELVLYEETIISEYYDVYSVEKKGTSIVFNTGQPGPDGGGTASRVNSQLICTSCDYNANITDGYQIEVNGLV